MAGLGDSRAVMSEDQRLKAQRRMLAERYGLIMSDDEEEGADPVHLSYSGQLSSPRTRNADDQASTDEFSAVASVATDDPEHNISVRPQSSSPTRSTAADVVRKPSPRPMNLAELKGGDEKDTNVWPGISLSRDGHIPRCYTLNRSQRDDQMAKRQLRVTPVTVYHSQLVLAHARKIAVNDRVITYAVGGHIRAIVRSTGCMALLKGHESVVTDVELLGATESRFTTGPWAGCSVLGSVAEDGAAYIWRILRGEEASDQLQVGEAIPIFHPDRNQHGKYSRIAFRPGKGSIVVDIGVGVCICLVDPDSPNLRVAEMVKMNGEIIIRDKYLRAAEEPTVVDGRATRHLPVSACVWLNEQYVVLSRGAGVYVWNFNSLLCIGLVPRSSKTLVQSLYALREDVLLIACDEGRSLELWHVADQAQSGPKFVMSQIINLAERNSSGPTDVFQGVVAVDPKKEIISVANAKGNFFFALHYDERAKAVDAISEIPTKKPIFSVSITNDVKSEPQKDRSGLDTPSVVSEVGLWCVQPDAVQLLHLKPGNCAPPSSSSQTTKSCNLPCLNEAGSVPVSVSKKLPESLLFPKLDPTARTTAHSEKTPCPIESIHQWSSPPISIGLEPAPSISVSVSCPASTPLVPCKQNESDVAAAVLCATKKVINSFKTNAEARNNAENERMLMLISNIKQDVEQQISAYVTDALQKQIGEGIIPAVSKIVIDVRNAARSSICDYLDVGGKGIAVAFEDLNLVPTLKSGCEEVIRQVTSASDRSFRTEVASVKNSMDDIVCEMSRITEPIYELSTRLHALAVDDITSENHIRRMAVDLIEHGNVNEAFMLVLNNGQVELTIWLCSHFDSKTFFETNVLDQVAVLALISQLGQALGEVDSLTTVKWLRELMLVLEIGDDAITEMAGETLCQLRESVEEIQRKKSLLQSIPGLSKELKTLQLLLTSMVS